MYGPPPLPPHRSGVPGGIVALIGVMCVLVGLMGGCVMGLGINAEPDPKQPSAAATSSRPPKTAEAQAAEPPSKSPSKTASPSPKKIRVPNVIGHNHQAAQNEMQAAGLYGLHEEDATGQGRMLIWDRNWVVVRQSPKAGTKVTAETTITLYSKKIGE